MSGWGLLGRVIDVLLGVAIRADELAERRRARRRDLLGEDDRSKPPSRSKVPTVVMRRPKPPPR